MQQSHETRLTMGMGGEGRVSAIESRSFAHLEGGGKGRESAIESQNRANNGGRR